MQYCTTIGKFVKSQQKSGRSLSRPLVSDGLFSDFNDFFNEAIVEKLGGMEPITLRDIPYSQQRDEIIKYAEEHIRRKVGKTGK